MKNAYTRTAVIILLALAMLAAGMPSVLAEKAQVQETVLPNGLKVITKEVHAAPVVSFMVWYKVGSRNEMLGKTGLSHLLEHMQFKGTKKFKKGEVDKLVQRNGGMSNAATWKDFTFYFQTMSSDKLELSMQIESDRMVNSVMDPKEHKAEMTVVRSELEGDENEPDTLIYYELYATAFKAHPYQWPTIGWRHDVESITRDDIYKYYKTYYMPSNATVVIVGDFDTEKALALAKKYFGRIPRGPEPPKMTAEEPEQMGERRSEVRKAGAAYRVMMGYHTPAIGHPDIYALDVLELVLSGGESGRLYKALVDRQLATQAWASAGINKDPDLFVLGGTARDGVDIKDVEAALLAEVERVKSEPITDDELQKALNQLEAQFTYTNDSVTAQARQLGYYETIYSWRYLEEYLENARKVTKADVRRVAQKYLSEKNRTVVTFVPDVQGQRGKGAEEQGALPTEKLAAYRPGIGSQLMPDTGYRTQGNALAPDPSPRPERWETSLQAPPLNGEGNMLPSFQNLENGPGDGGISSIQDRIKPTRVVLENGMTVIVHENRSNPTVAIQGSVNAGSMLDPRGKGGLAGITADLLSKGTSRRTAEQTAAEKDFVGMSLDTSTNVEFASFSGRALSKHFDLLLDLLSDTLRNTSFPADEFEKLKARRLSGLKEETDDPQSLAYREFYGSVFPEGHPYHRRSVDEETAEASAITRDDVLGFYKSHYGPQGAILVIVGDVDTREAVARVRQYFGDWSGPASERPRIPDTLLQSAVAKKVIPIPDKSQVEVILGYAGGLKRSDPDFYAANVMNFILGGGGALGSRMGDVIRDEMGLVYGVYSTFDATLGAGPWYASLGTNPENADKAINALVEQIELMRDKGATGSEMEDAVAYLTGSFPVRLEKNASIAGILHSAEFYGLGMDYIRGYQQFYRSVTLDQVNAAAKKYLHPDRYTLVIAGPYRETK